MHQQHPSRRRNGSRFIRLVTLGSALVLIGCHPRRQPPAEQQRTDIVSHDDRPFVHRLVLHNARHGLADGEINGLPAAIRYGGVVVPCPAPARGAAQGAVSVYVSPVVATPIPFNEALMSWNIDVPPNVSFGVELRVGRAVEKKWSPFLHLADWGPAPPAGERILECDEGRIDIDYFRSRQRYDRLQYRIRALHNGRLPDCSSNTDAAARIARVGICVSDTTSERDVPAAARPDADHADRVVLAVPYRSQRDNGPKLAGRTCSPTSISMVLAHWGVDRPTVEVAQRVYDRVHDIYGNWPRSIQCAYSYGAPGYLDRFAGLDEVRWLIDRGQPVIASITGNKGELENAPYQSTRGHLLVIVGFDPHGNVIVNDPAARNAKDGRRTYQREQIEEVWLRHKAGTAYVLQEPPDPIAARIPSAKADEPVVDLWAVDPRIVTDVRYATTNNFTGQKLYPVPRCMLRESVALRLRLVQDQLVKRGLGLKVYDGYRPRSVQEELWKIMPDPDYVAPPQKGSRHNRGGAVDLTLVDAEGKELEMPTPFDSFAPAARADYAGGTATSRKNRDMLIKAMRMGRFRVLATEWWHFDAPGWENYPVLDVPLVDEGNASTRKQ